VRVVATRTAAPARVLTYEEFNSADPTAKCSVEPQLTLPMSFEVDIDDGGVVATIDGDLAIEEGDDHLQVFADGSSVLRGEWKVQAEQEFGSWFDGPTPERGDLLALYDEWPSVGVDVSAANFPYRRVGVLWRGSFGEQAP
jgi:hypothetical protein